MYAAARICKLTRKSAPGETAAFLCGSFLARRKGKGASFTRFFKLVIKVGLKTNLKLNT